MVSLWKSATPNRDREGSDAGAKALSAPHSMRRAKFGLSTVSPQAMKSSVRLSLKSWRAHSHPNLHFYSPALTYFKGELASSSSSFLRCSVALWIIQEAGANANAS